MTTPPDPPTTAPDPVVTPGRSPNPEECIEQVYFFKNFRERLEQNMPAQDILVSIHEEVLATTSLPLAIQFLSTELKHSGRLSRGFELLPHYFTPFQTFVLKQAEDERQKLTMDIALLLLEREAEYKSHQPTPAGLFVYQFEAISRNRLGYSEGLTAMQQDPFYGPDWSAYIDQVRRQGGVLDFADLVYWRSALFVQDERRKNPQWILKVPALFGEREGRIARVARGRDPLYLFAALQRQLKYPQVPKLKAKDTLDAKLDLHGQKLRELETRLRIVEGEVRGTFDPTQFGQPDLFRPSPDEET